MRPKFMRFWFFILFTPLALGVACKKAPVVGVSSGPLKADVGVIAFPSDVLAFGGLRSLDDFSQTVANIVAKFNPQLAAMVSAQIPALLQGQLLGVKSLEWLDAKKPIRFVVLDYKKFEEPLVLVLPYKNKDALLGSLPENKISGAPDNETKFTSPMGTDLFLNILDDHAVFAMHPKAFSSAKEFIKGEFARYEFTELLDIQASSSNFQRIAAPEIEEIKQELAKASTEEAALYPGIEKLLEQEMELLMDLLRQTEVARLALRFDGDNIIFKTGLKVLEGKTLARLASGTKERKMELYRSLPPGGWLVVAANMDPQLSESFTQIGMDFWAGLLKLTAEEKVKLETLTKKLLELQTGDTAFWIGRDGDFPLRILSINGVKDGEQAKVAAYSLYTLLFSKLGRVVEEYSGPASDTLKLDWTSFPAFVESLKPTLAEIGITPKFKSETVSGVSVDALEMTVDFSKVPGAHEAAFSDVARMIGNKVSGAFGFDKTHLYGTFGKDAIRDIAVLAKGSDESSSNLSSVVTKLSSETRPAFAAYLSFVDLMKLIAIFDDQVKKSMPGLDTAGGEIGFSFVIGGHGDQVLDAFCTIPVAKIAKLLPIGGPVAPVQ